MSLTLIEIEWVVDGELTDVQSAKFSDPTGAFGLKRRDTGEILIEDGEDLPRASKGKYAFAITDPAPNLTYDYYIEIVDEDGETIHIPRTQQGGSAIVAEPDNVPQFTFIPVVVSPIGVVDLRIVLLRGISTKHGQMHTRRGVAYGDVTRAGNVITVRLFSDYTRRPGAFPAGNELCAGSGLAGEFIELAAIGATGVTGRALVVKADADALFSAVVSLSVDADVQSDPNRAAAMPGHDPVFGLASKHAAAATYILASALPAAVPQLYAVAGPINPFVPPETADAMPDLTKLVNPEALRQASVDLVKALSWQEQEHVEEGARLAAQARARFDADLAAIIRANVVEVEEAESEAGGGPQFSSFTRG